MSSVCEFTGKKPFFGNNVSHSNRKTRRRWEPNLHDKKYLIPELGTSVTVRLSTRAVRTIDKYGTLSRAILCAAKEDFLSERLQKIRRALIKKSQVKSQSV